MVECNLETSVVDWVIEHPGTATVLEQLGIDYCCGGKSLAYACLQQGLDAQRVLSMLQRYIDANKSNDTTS